MTAPHGMRHPRTVGTRSGRGGPDPVRTKPGHLEPDPVFSFSALPSTLAVYIRDGFDFHFQPRIDQRPHFH